MSLGYPPPFVEPAYRWVPPGGLGNYGDEVVDFTHLIGLDVDAEQGQAIGDCTTYGRGGVYLAPETCVIEGRQNGKTERIGLPIALYDVFVRGLRDPDGNGDVLTWTSHLMDTTLKTFGKVKQLIEGSPELSRRVATIAEGKGEESVELTDGSAMEFRTRSTGRGRSGQIWVADEWLEGTSAQVGTRMPTLRTRPGAQIRYYSSACLAKSAALRRLVRRGRSMADPALVYIEFCGPGSFRDPGCERDGCTHTVGTPGCTLDREELWHLGSHSLGRRVSYAWQRGERLTMDPTEFAREIFGWHEDGPEDEGRHPLLTEDWTGTAVMRSVATRPTPAFFVTIGVDGAAVIAAAAPAVVDGRPHVELADRRPGSEWLPERLRELAARWPGAVFGAGKAGPVAGMVDAGALPVEVQLLSPAEMAQGCRHHEKLSKGRGYTHTADADVDLSLAGAFAKPAGDGLWAWDWRQSRGLAPVAAVTGALWLLEAHPSGLPQIY